MKFKDFAFYAVSTITLIAFVFLPIAYGLSPEEVIPGIEMCKEILRSVEHYLASRY